jgi:hypothetical protein
MPVNNAQPTILVKKSDGTSVRMTFDELKKYKASQKKNPVSPLDNVDTVDTVETVEVKPKVEDEIKNTEADDAFQFLLDQTEDDDLSDTDSGSADLFSSPEYAKTKTEASEDDAFSFLLEKSDDKPLPPLLPPKIKPLVVDTKKEDVVEEIDEVEEALLPVVQEHIELATTTPVVDAFVDAAAAKLDKKEKNKQESTPQQKANMVQWEDDDHISLLEDDTLEIEKKQHRPTTNHKQERVENILASLALDIPKEKQESVRSLILSRIKEVRNDDQVRAYVVRPIDKGGLGLPIEAAEALVAAIKGDNTPPPIKNKKISAINEIPRINEKSKKLVVENNTVNTALPKQNQTRQSSGKKPLLHDIRPAPVQQPVSKKPAEVVTPVIPTPTNIQTKTTVGPVDELRNMDIVAFRRLAADSAQAIEIVTKKFDVLKKESYLLFMQARSAWFKSPLYKQYQELIATALRNRRSIESSVSKESHALTVKEFENLIILNKIIS